MCQNWVKFMGHTVSVHWELENCLLVLENTRSRSEVFAFLTSSQVLVLVMLMVMVMVMLLVQGPHLRTRIENDLVIWQMEVWWPLRLSFSYLHLIWVLFAAGEKRRDSTENICLPSILSTLLKTYILHALFCVPKVKNPGKRVVGLFSPFLNFLMGFIQFPKVVITYIFQIYRCKLL